MDRTVFIINPFSAKRQSDLFIQKLKTKVDPLHYYLSESVEKTTEFILETKDQYDVYVAVGGDGTIASVAKNLVHSSKILAVFPAGSGNGFSNETHFNTNLEVLLQKLKARKSRKIDTFKIGPYLSINVSGAGLDARVAKEFESTTRGFKNYIKVTLKTFFNYRPIQVRFHTQELEKYSGEYMMLNLANTRQFGNFAYIAPKASKSDGLVDLVLVKKFPLPYSLFFAFRLFTKALKQDSYLTYIPISKAEFSVDTTVFQMDGEFVELNSPIQIEVLPQSLNILI